MGSENCRVWGDCDGATAQHVTRDGFASGEIGAERASGVADDAVLWRHRIARRIHSRRSVFTRRTPDDAEEVVFPGVREHERDTPSGDEQDDGNPTSQRPVMTGDPRHSFLERKCETATGSSLFGRGTMPLPF
jgi:hypothetical protein